MPSITYYSQLRTFLIAVFVGLIVSAYPAFPETITVDGIVYAYNHIDDDYMRVHKDIPDGEAIVWMLPNDSIDVTIPSFIFVENKKCFVKNVAAASGVSIYSYGRSIENITIQEGIQSLDRNSFYGCRKLKKITIPASCISIENGAIPTVDSSGLDRYYDISLEEIEVAKDNPVYESIDGVLYSKKNKSLVVYPARKKEKEYKIPENIETIENTIGGIDSLEKVSLSKSLKEIKTVLFNGHKASKNMEISIPKEIELNYQGNYFWDMYIIASVFVFPNPYGDDIGINRAGFKVLKTIPEINELDSYVFGEELEKANSGDYVSQFIVSQFFLKEHNLEESIKYLGLSAMQGFIPAFFYLGNAYFKGEGVPQDNSGASFFYYLAASNSYVEAFIPVAECYLNGTGCKKDEREGKRYIYEAAKHNIPRALYYTGKWTYYGEQWNRFGEKLYTEDKEKGLEILQKAASLNDELACYVLGRIYEKNNDIDNAVKFYLQARDNGYVLEKEKLDLID